MLPPRSVTRARAKISWRQSLEYWASAVYRIRNSAANPAAFVADAMKAVTGLGEPSYTSGVHMWNGTAATLKASPTKSRTMPAISVPSLTSTRVARKAWMPSSDVVPVAPYTSATPYKKIAEENAPSTKYLMPASSERARVRSYAARTYSGIDSTSSATNTTMRSFAPAMTNMPAADMRTSATYSGRDSIPRATRYSLDSSNIKIAEMITMTLMNTEKPSSAVMCASASDGPPSMTTLHCFVR